MRDRPNAEERFVDLGIMPPAVYQRRRENGDFPYPASPETVPREMPAMRTSPPTMSIPIPQAQRITSSLNWPTSPPQSDTAGNGTIDLDLLLPLLERLLRNATNQLSDVAQVWSVIARAAHSVTDPMASTPEDDDKFNRPFTIADESRSQPPSPYQTASQLEASPPEPGEKYNSKPAYGRGERIVRKTAHKLIGRPQNAHARIGRSRQDPNLQDLRYCPDCGKRGGGSKSQSGVTYYYCRNPGCSGRGATFDKYIGWSINPA